MNKIIEAHRFFVEETPKYLLRKYDKWGNDRLKWKTKETWNKKSTQWYYPLSFRKRLYYPIAYIKFMFYSLTD